MKAERIISFLFLTLAASFAAGAQDYEDYLYDDPTALDSLVDSSAVAVIDSLTPQPCQRVKPALVLPFSTTNSQQNVNMMDFYCGVLMAVREAGEEGLDIELEVKDIVRENGRLEELDSCDFILGPVHPDDIARVMDILPGKTVFSPLDPRAENMVSSCRNLVQLPPYSTTQFKEAAKWAKELDRMSGEVIAPNYILLVSDTDHQSWKEAKYALQEENIRHHLCKCSVQGEIEGWENAYNPLIHNYVFIAISNEAALNNAVRNISIEVAKENVTAFTGNKIRSYSTIPLENIHRAGIHAVCSYYVDYEDTATAAFIEHYKKNFKTLPSQFAFQGYDLAQFAIWSFAQYGPAAWRNLVWKEESKDLLQTSIHLTPIPGGGLINDGVRRVEYRPDYSIVLVK